MNDLEKSKNPKIPLLTGICKDETTKAVKGSIFLLYHCTLFFSLWILGHLKEDVVKKLTTIPNFLDKVLVTNLRQSIPIALNVINSTITNLIPLNFGNYLKLNTDTIADALDKVADVTSKWTK